MSILVCCPLQLLLQGPPATVAAESGTSLAFLVTYTYCLNLKQMQEKALEPYCSQQVLKSVMPRCEAFKHKQTHVQEKLNMRVYASSAAQVGSVRSLEEL